MLEGFIRADFGRIGPITGCQDQAVVQLLRSQARLAARANRRSSA